MNSQSNASRSRIPVEIISVNASRRSMMPAPEYVPRVPVREVPAAYRDSPVTQEPTKNTQPQQQVREEPPNTVPHSQENTRRKVINKS